MVILYARVNTLLFKIMIIIQYLIIVHLLSYEQNFTGLQLNIKTEPNENRLTFCQTSKTSFLRNFNFRLKSRPQPFMNR